MSVAPVFAKGRDLDATVEILRPWLAARLGVDDLTVGELTYPIGAGVSNETLLLEARSAGRVDDLVLRIGPRPEHQMFLDPRFRMQYDLLAALRRDGSVRVPEPLWFEDDAAILGQPFFVMRRMRGRVPVSMPVYNKTGWLTEATPAQRRTLWESAVRQLAAIHVMPVDEVGFVDLAELGSTGPEQQLTYWNRFAAWALEDEIPDAVRTLFEWLAANRPTEPVPGLSWGDARIGNMMFGADFEVVGVMDWEQASLAGPMADLGWWLHFDEIHSSFQGLARLDGLGTRQETIDLWEELTGRRVENLLWHEVFACVKTALLGLHTRRSMRLPVAGRSERGPYLQRAYRLLDLNLEELP
ncbi:phosphotransferase family protein [Parafrankia discariae]|uniref:phosphotransferase family protein n=1 Tax=Parafrankia discariae TaxID=365528 RepID=UPI00037A2093|nr:phosphotransferase family protein [Parafrankia discariae]